MTIKHTQGPWIVDCDKSKDGSILIRDSQDWPIARVDCLKPSNPDLDYEGEANAQLMATVPELLKACEEMIELITKPFSVSEHAERFQFTRDTIARAKGEKK